MPIINGNRRYSGMKLYDVVALRAEQLMVLHWHLLKKSA
jgi:hypothetical protein